MRGLLISFLVIVAAPVAACDFCSSSTVLDEARADCFIAEYDKDLQRLKGSSRGMIQINLDQCALQRDIGRSTVGTQLPDPTGAYAAGAKIIVDLPRMECMRRLIEADQVGFGERRLIAIPDACD